MTFAHLTIATRNVKSTSDFLAQVMRWKRIEMPANIDVEAVWLEVAPGQQVHILGIPDFFPSNCEREYGRHFAFFHDASDLDGVANRLAELGHEVIAPLRPTPFRRFFFRDPNGYLFEVIDRDNFVIER